MSMSTADRTVRSVLTSQDGAVEILRSDPDHVSVRLLVPGPGERDVLAASRLLCGAVADQRAHYARHVQTSVDGGAPSGGIYLQALRARIGTDVRSITMRRAGSSVMVDLHLMPPARKARRTRSRPGTEGPAVVPAGPEQRSALISTRGPRSAVRGRGRRPGRSRSTA